MLYDNPATQYYGEMYRVSTGFQAPGSVADVIRYETEELENDIHFNPELLPELEAIPARECAWVCFRKENARRYGKEIERYFSKVIILGSDDEGGYLVLNAWGK